MTMVLRTTMLMMKKTYLITLVPPNSPLSLSSRRFNFARTDDSPDYNHVMTKMLMMMMMLVMMMMMMMLMMMMLIVGGLQTTNRLGSWVEQPNRMNLSLLERDDDD